MSDLDTINAILTSALGGGVSPEPQPNISNDPAAYMSSQQGYLDAAQSDILDLDEQALFDEQNNAAMSLLDMAMAGQGARSYIEDAAAMDKAGVPEYTQAFLGGAAEGAVSSALAPAVLSTGAALDYAYARNNRLRERAGMPTVAHNYLGEFAAKSNALAKGAGDFFRSDEQIQYAKADQAKRAIRRNHNDAQYKRDLASGMGEGEASTRDFLRSAWTGVENFFDTPTSFVDTTGQLVGELGVQGLGAKGLNKLTGIGTSKLGRAATQGTATVTTEAVSGIGNAAEAIDKMSDKELLNKSPEFQELYADNLAQGKSYEQAIKDARTELKRQASVTEAIGSGLSALVGAKFAKPLDKIVPTGAGSATKGLLKDMSSEGLEEAITGFGQGLSSNIAARQTYNPEQRLLENVGEQVTEGALAGATGSGALRAPGSLMQGYDNIHREAVQKQVQKEAQALLTYKAANEDTHNMLKAAKEETKAKVESPTAKVNEQAEPIPTVSESDSDVVENVPYKEIITDDGGKEIKYDDPSIDDPLIITEQQKADYELEATDDALNLLNAMEERRKKLEQTDPQAALKIAQDAITVYDNLKKNMQLRQKYAQDIVRNSKGDRDYSSTDYVIMSGNEALNEEEHNVRVDNPNDDAYLQKVYNLFKDIHGIYKSHKALVAKINTPEQAEESDSNLAAFTFNMANGDVDTNTPQLKALASRIQKKSNRTAQEEAFLKVYNILDHARGKIYDLTKDKDEVSRNILTKSKGNKTSLNDYIASINRAIANNDTETAVKELNRLRNFTQTRINKVKALQEALINNNGGNVKFTSVNGTNQQEFEQSTYLGSFKLLDSIQTEQEAAVDIYNNIANILKADSKLASNIPSSSLQNLSAISKLENEAELKDIFAKTHFSKGTNNTSESEPKKIEVKEKKRKDKSKKKEKAKKTDAEKAKDIVDRALTPNKVESDSNETTLEPSQETKVESAPSKELSVEELMPNISDETESENNNKSEPALDKKESSKEVAPSLKTKSKEQAKAKDSSDSNKELSVEDLVPDISDETDEDKSDTISTESKSIPTKSEKKEEVESEEEEPQFDDTAYDSIDESPNYYFKTKPTTKVGNGNTVTSAVAANMKETATVPTEQRFINYNNFVQTIRNIIFKSRKIKDKEEASKDVAIRIDEFKDKVIEKISEKEISKEDLEKNLTILTNFSDSIKKFFNGLLNENNEGAGNVSLNLASWIRENTRDGKSAAYLIFGFKKDGEGKIDWSTFNRDRLVAVGTQFNSNNEIEFNPELLDAIAPATLATIQLIEKRLTIRGYDEILKELEEKKIPATAIKKLDHRERILMASGIPLETVVDQIRRQLLNVLRVQNNPNVSLSFDATVIATVFAQIAVRYLISEGKLDYDTIYFDSNGNKYTHDQYIKIKKDGTKGKDGKNLVLMPFSYAVPTTVYDGVTLNKQKIKVKGHEFNSRAFEREFENLFNIDRPKDVYYRLEDIPPTPENKLRSSAKHTEAEKTAIANREKTPYMLDKDYHEILDGIGEKGVLKIASLDVDPDNGDFNETDAASVKSRIMSTKRELALGLERAKIASEINPDNPTIYQASVMNKSGRNQELTPYGSQASKLFRYLFSHVKSPIDPNNPEQSIGFKRAVLQAFGLKIKRLDDNTVSEAFNNLIAKLEDKYSGRNLLQEMRSNPDLIKELYDVFGDALKGSKENPWLALSAIINTIRYMEAFKNETSFENTLPLEFDGSCNGFANSHMKLAVGDSITSKSISAMDKSNMYFGHEDEDSVDAYKTLKEDNYTSNAEGTQENIQNRLSDLKKLKSDGKLVPVTINEAGNVRQIDELDVAVSTLSFIGAIMGNLVKVNYQALLAAGQKSVSDLIRIARIIVKFPTTRNNYGQGKPAAVESAINDLSDELSKKLTNIVQNKSIPPCESFYQEEIESGEMTKEQALHSFNAFVLNYQRLNSLKVHTETKEGADGEEIEYRVVTLNTKKQPKEMGLLRFFAPGELATEKDIENFKKFQLQLGDTINEIFKQNLAEYFVNPMYDAIQASKSEAYSDFSNKLASISASMADNKRDYIIAKLNEAVNREPVGILPSPAELELLIEEANKLFPTEIETVSMRIDTAGDANAYQDDYYVESKEINNLKVKSPIKALDGRSVRAKFKTSLGIRLPKGNGIAPVALLTIATGDGTMQTILFNYADNHISNVDRYDGVDTDPALYHSNAELINKASYDVLKELPTKSFLANVRTYYATSQAFINSGDPIKFNIIVNNLIANDKEFEEAYKLKYPSGNTDDTKQALPILSKRDMEIRGRFVLKYMHENYVQAAEAYHRNAVIDTITLLSLPTSMHHMSSGPEGYNVKDPRDTFSLPPGLTMAQKEKYIEEEANRRRAIIAEHADELVKAYDERGELLVPPEVYENIPKIHAPEPIHNPEQLTEQDEYINKILDGSAKDVEEEDVIETNKEEKEAPTVEVDTETKKLIDDVASKDITAVEEKLTDSEKERKQEEAVIQEANVKEMPLVNEVKTTNSTGETKSTIGVKELVSAKSETYEREVPNTTSDRTVSNTAPLGEAPKRETTTVQPENKITSRVSTGRLSPLLQVSIEKYTGILEKNFPELAPIFKSFFTKFINENIADDLKVVVFDDISQCPPIVQETIKKTNGETTPGLYIPTLNAIYINEGLIRRQESSKEKADNKVHAAIIHELLHSVISYKFDYVNTHADHPAYKDFDELYRLVRNFEKEIKKNPAKYKLNSETIAFLDENIFNLESKSDVVNEFVSYLFNNFYLLRAATIAEHKSKSFFSRFKTYLKKIFNISNEEQFKVFSTTLGRALTLYTSISSKISNEDASFKEYTDNNKLSSSFKNLLFDLSDEKIKEINTKLYDSLNDAELSKVDLIDTHGLLWHLPAQRFVERVSSSIAELNKNLGLTLDATENFVTASLSLIFTQSMAFRNREQQEALKTLINKVKESVVLKDKEKAKNLKEFLDTVSLKDIESCGTFLALLNSSSEFRDLVLNSSKIKAKDKKAIENLITTAVSLSTKAYKDTLIVSEEANNKAKNSSLKSLMTKDSTDFPAKDEQVQSNRIKEVLNTINRFASATDKLNDFVAAGDSRVSGALDKYITKALESDTFHKMLESKSNLTQYLTIAFGHVAPLLLHDDNLHFKHNRNTRRSFINNYVIRNPGFLAKTLLTAHKELSSADSNADNIYAFEKKAKAVVQANRNNCRDLIPQKLKDLFIKEKVILDSTQSSNLNTVILTADLGALTDQEVEILFDRGLNKELNRVANNIPATARTYCQALAHYIVTGYGSSGMLRNAKAITRAITPDKSDYPALEHAIDVYTTLLVLDKFRGDFDAAKDIYSKAPNAFKFAVEQQRALRRDELNKITETSDGGVLNAYKGYYPRDRINNNNTILVSKHDVAKYEAMGYTITGKTHRGGKDYYMSSTINPLSTFDQGALQTVVSTNAGVDSVTGWSVGNKAVFRMVGTKFATAIMPTKAKDFVFAPQKEAAIPVFNEDGEIKGLEYLSNPEMFSNEVRETDFAVNLANWTGRQIEEKLANNFNENIIKELARQYKEADAYDKEHEFVNIIELAKEDPVIKQALKNIPLSTVRFINEYSDEDMRSKRSETTLPHTWYIRRDLVDDVLGRRQASVVDLNTGVTRWSPKAQKVFSEVAKHILGPKAYKYLYYTENVVKSLSSSARNFIVIRSAEVMAFNIIGNLMSLMIRGVPLATIIREAPKIVKELEYYNRSKKRRAAYQLRLNAELGKDKPNRKHIEVLQRHIDKERKSYDLMPYSRELILAGEYNTIADIGTVSDDLLLSTGRFGEYIEKQVDKLPDAVKKIGKNIIVTKDTEIYRMLEKGTQYGDFVAKVILYKHLVENKKIDPKNAISKVRYEFVNYDMLPGRSREYLENIGLLWFYNYKLRVCRTAMSMIKDNPLSVLISMFSPLAIGVGTPISDNFISKLVTNPLGSVGPKLFDIPWITNHMWYNLFDYFR